MKRAILLITTFAVLLGLSVFPLMAQGRGGAGMGGNPGMGQGRGPGMGPGNGPMGRQPGMGEPGMHGDTNTTTNGPMMHQKSPSQLLAQNTQLSEKLQNLLPPDEKVQEAASGFKNLGQFVAAVHVAHNLNLPFDQFKNKVTSGDNLGKAIHSLDPKLSHKQIKSQVKKAKHEAKADIKASHRV